MKITALLIALAAWFHPAQKTISIVVPYPPGTTADISSRILGKQLSEDIHQPVVIINKPGKDSIPAINYTKQQPADGYTLLVSGKDNIVANACTDVPYDIINDFSPITTTFSFKSIIISVKFKNTQELTVFAKHHSFNIGILSTEISKQDTTRFLKEHHLTGQMVVYKSAPEEVIALQRGDIQIAYISSPTVFELVKSHKLYSLENTSELWLSILVKSGTSEDRIDYLNKAIRKALEEVKPKTEAIGMNTKSSTPEELSNKQQQTSREFTK